MTINPITTGEGTPSEVRITHTWLGAEYGWDTVAQVDWRLLRNNLSCAQNILANPAKFPKADKVALSERVHDLEVFIALHAPMAA